VSKINTESDLLVAAAALDEELQKFDRLSEKLRTSPFDSQKHLGKAAETLRALSDSDQELGKRVNALIQAISTVRDRQQKQADLVHARAVELQERTAMYQQLMEGYALLGQSGTQLNELLGKLVGDDVNKPPERTPQLEEGLRDLTRGMGEVATAAKTLGERATSAGFPDVERLTEGLRQQILATRNKLKLLSRQLGIPEQAEA